MTKAYHTITSDRLVYGPIEDHLVKDLYDYGSDELVSKFIGWPLLTSLEKSQDYLDVLIDKDQKQTHVYATIAEKGQSKHIGTMMLFAFDKEARNAEIGYVLHQAYWGKGYISEAVKATVDYAQNVLGLHKLCARVVDDNKGSSLVLEKNNFRLEGQLKDQFYIEGQYYDCLIYGLVLEDK
jgi:ribosomal-protein-alanine N-acetyltransferase